MQTVEVTVKATHIAKFKKGYPLIQSNDLMNPKALNKEGDILILKAQDGSYIAKGYYGRQNKGVGWVLTNKQHISIDETFFKQKITTARGKRHTFYQDPNTNAFRVFNGEGDGIGGMTIDFFAGYYLINWYSQGIYAFKSIVVSILKGLNDCLGVYQKCRYDTKGHYLDDDDFVAGERVSFPLTIKENGMHYAVDLNDGAMVGIFLDQRDVRQSIRNRYAGKKHVLNTFSYTGVFSVAAIYGGATKTTSVDLAKRSRPKTIEQFQVNQIDEDGQEIIVMDVFDYFKYARRKQRTFDLVILDPPSFARSKKRTFSVVKDYTSMVRDAISVTANQGVIVASTNNATIHMKKFKQMIDQAFKDEGCAYQLLESHQLPADFVTQKNYPEGNYLKVCIVQLKN